MCAYKRKEKKIKKLRGSRTCGYGRVSQHRKSGQRGGKGKTGYKKHKWTYITAHDPNYFGKVGFKRPQRDHIEDRIVNIGYINSKIPQYLEENVAVQEGKTIKLNLDDLGYDKLLGKGNLEYKVIITAKRFSNSAIQKINDAGGQAMNIYEEKNDKK